MPEPVGVAILCGDDPPLIERLLAAGAPVWASRTRGAEVIADRLLKDGAPDAGRFTIFDFDAAADVGDQLMYVVSQVELHHGASGGHPQLRRLDVYGSDLTASVKGMLDGFGLTSVEANPIGFSAAAPER